MSLDDVIHVVIDRQSASLTLPGFGTPMILMPVAEVPAGWVTERLRYYTSAAAMLLDGFDATDNTYLEALAVFSQSPHPERVAVGRRLAAVAQVIDLTITELNTQLYTITSIFDGDESYGPFAFTSDASGTDAEIAAGLAGVINANPNIEVTASVGPADVLRLTADNPGVAFLVTESDVNLAQAITTPNVGIAEDLAAVTTEQPDWYCLLLTSRDDGEIMTAAAVIEAQRRIFIAQSADADIIATPYNSGTAAGDDIASKLRARGYARTALAYHPVATERLAAGWVGATLPFVAGSLTWKFKEIAGVAVYALTATQRTNLVSKNANGYENFGGRSITFEGTVAVGEFIDIIHGLDRLQSRIQELIAITFLSLPKVPMTQAGIQMIAANVNTALLEASNPTVALIADSRVNSAGKTEVPAFTVSPPSIADIPSGDRAARRIPSSNPIRFEATLAGAIHDVNILGTVAV